MKFQIHVSEIYSTYDIKIKKISGEGITNLNFQSYTKADKNEKMLASSIIICSMSHDSDELWEAAS